MRIRRLLQLVSSVVFLDTVMFAAITPLLPRYVEAYDLTKTQAGILVGAYPAGTFLAAVPAIWFARRFGVKLTVFVGLSGLGLSTAAFALRTRRRCSSLLRARRDSAERSRGAGRSGG
jgi:DHA1 family tetracycline resistance protein-like MFS transporter